MSTVRRATTPLSVGPVMAVLAGVFLVGAGPATALTPEEELTLAQDYFLVADHATALEKVEELLELDSLPPDLRGDAHLLQARCRLALGDSTAALDAYCSLLRVDPGWRPGADFLTADELASFRRALDLCGPLAEPASGRIVPGVTPGEATGTAPDLRLPPSAPRDRPWYRNPWLLGAAGGLTAGLILVLQDDGGTPPETSALPDFPPPPR